MQLVVDSKVHYAGLFSEGPGDIETHRGEYHVLFTLKASDYSTAFEEVKVFINGASSLSWLKPWFEKQTLVGGQQDNGVGE